MTAFACTQDTHRRVSRLAGKAKLCSGHWTPLIVSPMRTIFISLISPSLPHKEMTGGQRGLGGPKLVESEDECKISVSLRPYEGGHEMAKSQLLQDLVRLDFIWSLMSSHRRVWSYENDIARGTFFKRSV